MKKLVPFLCILALATAALGATEATTKSPAKKRSATITATPAPTKKKQPPVSDAEDATPAPAKKKTAPAKTTAAESTPAPKKPTPDEPPPTTPEASAKTGRAPAAILEPNDLKEFSAQPARVQQLITAALALTKQNLTYTFGSAEPARGGMDCSGTIYYTLRAQGFSGVPRDSSGQYGWARKAGQFYAVVSTQPDGFEFSDLQPGDLMFWTGTYQTGRDIPISHVMLYLGREKQTGKRVMFGASDGRSYAGIQRWGVSVFDFKMPKADPNDAGKRVAFIGYARIPGLRLGVAENAAPPTGPEPSKPHAPASTAPQKQPAKTTRKSG